MSWTIFIVSPLICGLIGWLTNRLAVKMLFRPKKPGRILGFTLHGVFPKRQKALAVNLGAMVEQELISQEDVSALIRDPSFQARFQIVADAYVERLINERLPASIPMAAMFLNDQVKGKVRDLVSEQLVRFIPKVLDIAAEELEDQLDVGEMVRKKVEEFSIDELEAVLESILKREFRFIEYLGGVLGAFIGLLQACVYWFWG
ncbi:DUF445 domain-containing protein [Oceanidesulfovibrio indonesiensis]|uniref:DUF445 domain-containing protein n=1 Tax=Oceanidesulfovibrio indonesiensis TaxID=54767 RepID=A0A7M3MGH3_9BACT|nr:DUF445 family protein [Oceanidesulfovibrio indonesiensis]TVM17972.1 DUF445 domain-containing protein [Oceanidesulfovibrio indonesiensis]